AVLILPEESLLTDARQPVWPWLFAIFGPVATSMAFGVPLPPAIGLPAFSIVNVTFFITLLVLITRLFHRSDPIGRRQLKWVVYGLYIGTVPALIAGVSTALDPSLWWFYEIVTIPVALIPVCIFIAIIRFNLFDIDRLISATAAYTIL